MTISESVCEENNTQKKEKFLDDACMERVIVIVEKWWRAPAENPDLG